MPLSTARYGEEWRQALLAYLRGNRDLVEEALETCRELAITHVEATYLAWIDCRDAGIENPGRFFEEAGVGLSDGTDFGAPGFVRLTSAAADPCWKKHWRECVLH